MNNVYWMLELSINPDQADNFPALMNDMVAATDANEPDTLAYEWHTSADGSTVHIYERYADSAAVMTHLGGFQPFAGRFMEILTPQRFTVYGPASDEVKEALAVLGAAYMEPAGGFIR